MGWEKIILFDIGNVFLKPIHGEIINIIYNNKHGNSNINNKEYTNRVKLILNDSFEGKITLEQTWNELFNLVGVYQTEKRNLIKKSFNITRNEELIKYVVNTLSKKHNIGIISDLSQIGYFIFNEYYKDLYEICDHDKIFISVETGRTKSKSGKMYFNEIVDKLGVNPNRIIFIDDEMNNIESARASNMNTILFESHEFAWNVANAKMIKEIEKIEGEI